MGQPNIVLVMSDQHRADVLGCAGDAAALTPNIDRLAAEGVRFTRANCQGPLCMPGRASFATERYVRDHGVFDNYSELAFGTPTFLHALQAAGYHTAKIGKTHLWMHSQWPGRTSWEMADHLAGFGFSWSLETLGKHASLKRDNPYAAHLREIGRFEDYTKYLHDRIYQTDGSQPVPTWDASPFDVSIEDSVDGWHGGQAVQWLLDYERDEPFLLWVGFPGPHDPWDAPGEARRWYDGRDIPAPGTTRPPDLTDVGSYRGLVEMMQGIADSGSLNPERIHDIRRAYYAGVSVIDRQVGAIRDALEATGRLDETWIIYTTDHGEMLGEHQLFLKCVFYDPSVRVPIVVRPPRGRPAKEVHDLVEQIDLAAAIRDIADADSVQPVESRSLLGYVVDDDPDQRAVSFTENWGFLGVETDSHKLVVDEESMSAVQLFDRIEDPLENHNLVADAAASSLLDDLMDEHVRSFLATDPVRPHESMFAGRS